MDRLRQEATAASDLAPLQLPALQHPLTATLMTHHRGLLSELSRGLGSTLHVLLPEVFDDTVRQFRQALDDAGVDGLVLFAKKANKGRSFVERCPALGIGIDAASLQETEQALGCGVSGEHIGITGPGKHPALLNLTLRQRCLVAIDSVEELRAYAAQAQQAGCRGRLLLRCRPRSQPHSRFGMTEEEREAALALCLQHRDVLDMEGFSFHLSGYSAAARAEEAHRLIDVCIDARGHGLSQCATIDIGGGFAVRYASEEHWSAFLERQQPRHYHGGKSFADFYPYYNAAPGAAMLSAILAHAVDGLSLAQRLREHAIRLLLEPGRALLDQAGFTMFEIQSLKDRQPDGHAAAGTTSGYGIVTVGGTSFSLSEQWFNSEYLPDPLLLPRQDAATASSAYAACVGGASCLDSDMVTWRKIAFPQRPAPGDLLIYLNTAGYQMDSNESPFHDLPLPAKVVITTHQGKPCWRLDNRPHAAFE